MGNGAIKYVITADVSQLKRDTERAKAMFRGMGDTVKRESDVMQRSLKRIGAGMATYLSVQQASRFASAIVKVRGEFQGLALAFETMLGSKQKADKMMSDIVDLAMKTPYTLTEVAGNTKQLMAMGIASEKVMGTMKSLGDVAAGLSVPMSRLAINYGQVATLGRLQGRELRDFAMAGVPLIEELAKAYGKTKGEIQEMVSAGRIGFADVEAAFKSMSGEGGKFADMMEKRNSTVTGQISNLQDKIEMMFNSIGEANEGIIYGAIEGASYLVAHYEDVGRVVLELVGIYGAYRVALMATKAVQIAATEVTKGYTLAQQMNYKMLLLGEKAQKLLNKTVLKNPYVLAAAAVAALAYGIYKLVTAETAAEKAQRKHNEALKEATERKEKLLGKAQQLASAIGDDTKTIYSQVKAWKALKKEMPEALQGMDMDSFKELSSAEQGKIFDKALNEKADRELEKKIASTEKSIEYYKKQLTSTEYATVMQALTKIKEEKESLRLLEKQRAERAKIAEEAKALAEYEAADAEGKLAILEQQKQNLEKQKELIEEQIPDYARLGDAMGDATKKAEEALWGVQSTWQTFDWEIDLQISNLEAVHDKIAGIDKKINGIKEATGNGINYGEAYATAKADFETAQKAFDAVKKNKNSKSVEDFKKAKEDLAAAKEAFGKLGGVTTGKQSLTALPDYSVAIAERKGQIEAYGEQVQAQIRATEFEIRQAELDALEEGTEKQMRQIELDYDRRISAIERKESELLEALRDAEALKWQNANPDYKETGKSFDRNSVTKADLSPKQSGQIKALREASQVQREKEEGDLLTVLLEKYRSYEQQKSDIHRRFDGERRAIEGDTKLSEATKLTAVKELEKQRMAAIRSVSNEEFSAMQESSGLLVDLFEDASRKSASSLLTIRTTAEGLLSYLKNTKAEDITPQFGFTAEQLKTMQASPEMIKDIGEAVKKLRSGALQKNPFAVLAADLKEVFKAGESEEEDSKATVEQLAQLGGSAASSADMIGGLAGNLGEMFRAMGNESAAEAMEDIEMVMSSVSNIGQGFAQGGIVGGIMATVGEATKWVTKIFQAKAAHEAALEAIEKELLAQERMNELLRYRNRLDGERFDAVFGTDDYGKAANAVQVYQDALQGLKKSLHGTADQKNKQKASSGLLAFFGIKDAKKELKQLYAGLAEIEVKTGHKKTGLFGWGKGKDIFSSVLDVYDDLIDKDGNLNKQLAETILATREMSEEHKNALQHMIAQYEVYEEAMDAVKGYLTDIFGELGGSISDALTDAFKNGTSAAEAFTDSVGDMLEQLAKQMIYSVTIAPYLEAAQADMLAVMDKGNLSEEEKFAAYAKILSGLADSVLAEQDMADKLMQTAKEIAGDRGIDVFEADDSYSQDSTRGYGVSMSQETGEASLGRLTGIHEHTAEMRSEMKAYAVHFQEMRNIGLYSMFHLEDIARYTAVLPTMAKDMAMVKQHTAKL